MRLYEMVYIFDASLDEDGVNAKLERLHKILTDAGAEIAAVDHWGARQLAYPIGKTMMGYYVVAQFHAPAEALPEFERIAKLDEQLLRYLMVLNEGEPTTGMSVMAEVHTTGDDDEDDDDDEDEDDDDDSPPEFQGGEDGAVVTKARPSSS
jgi:small subunit ribosomal protein S6